MYKGFYNLTSGMISQSRALNTVSNNIANALTPGYKKDIMATGTFREILLNRTGNIDKSGSAPLGGSQTSIRTVEELVTDFSQGSLQETGNTFDFALEGPGFFQIQTEDGLLYTRNGSFTLDDEGYLYLNRAGRVMGEGGPIMLGTDKITVNAAGQIFGEDGEALGGLIVADFEDYQTLLKAGEGLFFSENAPAEINSPFTSVAWRTIESSNVNMMDEMIAMMAGQRALQSAAQVLKMHDGVNGRAVTEIGKL